jgi:hypothetical protein
LAKENLRTGEIKNNLLLATFNKGYTAWQVAVLNGRVVLMQKLWELAKGN